MFRTRCKYLRVRSHKGQKYLFCVFSKQVILDECTKCPNFNPRANKGIKKKSDKLSKLEKKRDSKLIKSGLCEYCNTWSYKLDPHEIYGGSNRRRSIENGFVILLCRKCHENENILQELKIKKQKEFEQEHSREEFIRIIGKNYIQGE